MKSNILVSQLLPRSMERVLEDKGYSVIRLSPAIAIKSEVSFHPDVLCCKTPTGVWFGDSVVKPQMSDLVDFRTGLSLQNGYPHEVLYNCFFYDRFLFASCYTDKAVLQYADESGFETVFVKQGYTKCSVAVCGKDSFITADKGICTALEKKGYNILLIDGSDILLNGFSCGFIGGCCVMISDNLIAFTGSLDKMLDGESIKNFLVQAGIEILELSDNTLYDYGGLILV